MLLLQILFCCRSEGHRGDVPAALPCHTGSLPAPVVLVLQLGPSEQKSLQLRLEILVRSLGDSHFNPEKGKEGK